MVALTCDLDILLARKATTFSTVSLPLRILRRGRGYAHIFECSRSLINLSIDAALRRHAQRQRMITRGTDDLESTCLANRQHFSFLSLSAA